MQFPILGTAFARWLKSVRHGEHGQTIIVAGLMMVPLIGSVGVALDYGYGALEQRQAQAAADAAALSGTIDLPSYPALVQGNAVTVATANGFTDGVDGVTVTATNPPTTGPRTGDLKSVEVNITKVLNTRFMRVLNVNTMTISARAVATTAGAAFPCGIYVLNPSAADALSSSGNGTAAVNGGCIQVNSTSPSAAHVNGNAIVSSTGTNVGGGCVISGGAGAAFIPPCATGQPASIDPLLQVPTPSGSLPPAQPGCVGAPPTCTVNAGTGSVTYAPGVYGGISLSGNSSVALTLSPGTYIITGPMTGTGQAGLFGTGVTLYFACPKATSPYYQPCTTGQSGGSLSISGNNDFNLSGPTSGSYQGIVIYYDRNNVAPLDLAGNGGAAATGTIYAKSANVTITGNGSTYNSLIVSDKLTISGNGNTTINYNPANNYPTQQPGVSRLTE